jgi:hypothetical protein
MFTDAQLFCDLLYPLKLCPENLETADLIHASWSRVIYEHYFKAVRICYLLSYVLFKNTFSEKKFFRSVCIL